MLNTRETEILDIIKKKIECSSKEIHEIFQTSISYATVKRILSKLAIENLIITKGQFLQEIARCWVA